MDVTLADLKPSLLTVFVFFLLWLFVANVSKVLFVHKWHVPGLSELVANA